MTLKLLMTLPLSFTFTSNSSTRSSSPSAPDPTESNVPGWPNARNDVNIKWFAYEENLLIFSLCIRVCGGRFIQGGVGQEAPVIMVVDLLKVSA